MTTMSMIPTMPSTQLRRYRMVVFDFDGTLADSFPFFLDALDTLADIHNFRRIDRSELDTLRALSARQALKHIGLPLWKAPRVGDHFKTLMAQNAHRISLFPGITSMLRQLHDSGLALAILTSNSEQNVRTVLGSEASSLFSHWQCGSTLFGKADKLRRLLDESSFAREDVLCIGDEVRDMEAAQREKTDFGAVAWGYTSPYALRARDPTFLFEGPEEICATLGLDTGNGSY